MANVEAFESLAPLSSSRIQYETYPAKADIVIKGLKNILHANVFLKCSSWMLFAVSYKI